ncbi:efflux RND transporter periplasmic adaptor subunit [Nitrospina gracilis]|uniref:efflux RND transporter periplasmic adaptor subunit n=1 Tax=Nitrospina gracilis TaxID=35801 RepID=UPI001F019AE7|nr:efflux RND transporter periplasmic adaptor subunit [Nitrospina gracilis]MCF8720595.1 RND family efflux transporter MFP subunit [Nitrospina gracilis Nb-211]
MTDEETNNKPPEESKKDDEGAAGGKASDSESKPDGEEILFPLVKQLEIKAELPPEQKRFRWLNLVLLFVLVAGFYFIGLLTGPSQWENTKRAFSEFISFSKERIIPIKNEVAEYIEEKIQRPETPQGAKREGSGTEKQTAPMPGMKQEKEGRKVKYWQAPMDPSYKRDKPGKSPMGMDLIPVYEDETEDSAIKINPTVVQNIGVKTEKVRVRKLTHEIRTTGTLTYDERKVHHIHTKFGGWIEKLYVDFTGQEVENDDVLMEIYSPDLVTTQEEFLLALKYKESLKNSEFPDITRGANTLLETTRKRLKLFDVAEHQIEELAQTRQIKKTMHIHSPVRGFVVKKTAQEGMFVEPGKSLYTIADLSNIWVMADIYEYEQPWVKIGQEATMNLPYFPGKQFKGKVTYIDPFLDPKTRTIKVRMEFENPEWTLKPDMYANVTLKSPLAKEGVAVPEQAVIRSGEMDMVVVQNKEGRFETRQVALGVEADGYYQVLKGLKSGETVVTSSGFLIDSESRLREAMDKLDSTEESGQKESKKKAGKLELKLDNTKTAHQH